MCKYDPPTKSHGYYFPGSMLIATLYGYYFLGSMLTATLQPVSILLLRELLELTGPGPMATLESAPPLGTRAQRSAPGL